MRSSPMHSWLLVVACSVSMSTPAHAQTVRAVFDSEGSPLGQVTLQDVPCTPPAAKLLHKGLALLHNMTYEQARPRFEQVVAMDPDCLLGYWGAAMTYIHPLWPDEPREEELAAGSRLLAAAESRRPPTAYEAGFLVPIRYYFDRAGERTEQDRLEAFAAGWTETAVQFPEDLEIRLFRALSMLAAARGKPDMLEAHVRAGEMAQEILQVAPQHPGALHYAIHAFDLPELAARGEAAARAYGEVVPENPHALHMTSHIFTRLADWEASIRYNRRAGEAALRPPLNPLSLPHFFHSADYLVYALLQTGDDEAARVVHQRLLEMRDVVQPHPAAAYTVAAVPARLVLERQRWEEASRLDTPPSGTIPWDELPHLEAISTFARGLGAVRSGDLVVARTDLTRLGELRERSALVAEPFDWAARVRIQELALAAWILLAEGKDQDALRRMEEASRLSVSHEKHAVSPGSVLPATELYGDMLLHVSRPAEALAAYEASLERAPNRLNSLCGAARAAEALGATDAAERHYGRLLRQVKEESRLNCPQAAAFLRLSELPNPAVIDVHMHAPMSPGPVKEFAPRLQSMLESMDSLNVRYVMLTGVPDVLFAWRAEVEKQVGVLPGLLFPCVNGAAAMWGRPCFESGEDWPDQDRLRDHIEAGRVGALGEITTQFLGLGPSDPAFAPYFALAEEYDLPVFIHMLVPDPEWRYDGEDIGDFPVPDLLASAGDPLLLEEVLLKHPGVRVAVVHSGWPLAEEMVDILKRHPQVYAEVGLLQTTDLFPREQYYDFLRRLVDAGFSDRILFGSDASLEEGIAAIMEAPFLTARQKRDILCNNAARFLRLGDNICN